ncbi:uncharacterized protein LOC132950689 [Metopolophium dirhodum]|uniref:uncharacterized protein LOC132950689 n=1 Tax=Metopolophium dirhodum TaxID=44670 RepID=UPI00298F455A|nr:uncharacterized protein LOC132950689 [Metopolophium dirhodum]
MHFFGTIERIFTIFSASTARWGIFQKHCHQWTVKKCSETRWESHHSSVKAIRFQVKEIIDALDEINKTTNDSMILSETNSLTAEMCTYNFLISLCIWYSVLNEVNIVSKSLQNPQTNLNTSTKLLKALKIFLTEYRNNGFNAAKREAFKVDGAISAITKRFDQINTFNDVFGFLYDVEKLCYVPDLEILNCCKDLEIRLSDNDKKDLNAGAERTFSKLKLIKTYLRSTMSQQRLTGLATISIEKELSEQLNYEDIINDFASKKARKIKEL